MRALPIIYLLVASTAGAAFAVEDPRETADPSRWVEKAAQASLTEIESARLAQKRSRSPEVQTFAARMIADHGRLNEELAVVAKRKGLDVPAALDAEHRAILNELEAKSAGQFDALYSQHMVTDHASALDLFTQATQEKDRELAAFASKTLPILKEHKEMADKLAAGAGTSVKSTSSGEKPSR
jgi:putative membrane protein